MPGPAEFQYLILRVVPSLERGERINAGVVVFCQQRDYLAAKVQLDRDRLAALSAGSLDHEEVVANLEALRDIAAGKCDIGVANTYYWALMLNKEADRKPWAEATKVILPTFQGGGTHVNLSAVVLARYAPNKANAMKLIEWLVGDEAQHIYADMNYEYPVRPGIAINPTIASYGPLNADTIPLSKIADHKKAAANLVDKVGFDN